jgi:hypothetical protein
MKKDIATSLVVCGGEGEGLIIQSLIENAEKRTS